MNFKFNFAFLKTFFSNKPTTSKPQSASAASTSSTASSTTVQQPVETIIPVNLNEIQKKMIEEFSKYSNLTLRWSHE